MERRGNLLDREIADDAQEQHVTLVGAQPLEGLEDLPGPDVLESLLLDVSADPVPIGLSRRFDRPAGPVAALVDHSVVGDHEHPGSEPRLVSIEGFEVPGDLEEHLPEEIVGIGGSPHGQVPAHRPGHVVVEAGPGPFGPALGGEKDRFERLGHEQALPGACGDVTRISVTVAVALKGTGDLMWDPSGLYDVALEHCPPDAEVIDVTDERPSIDEVVDGLTLVDVLATHADERAESGALRWKKGDRWEVLTWSAYRRAVIEAAAGFIDLGVAPGDVVGIIAGNRPEHLICDLGVIHAGGVPVSFYTTMAPSQLADVMADCGARVVVVDGAESLARLSAAAPAGLEVVVVIEPVPAAAGRTIGWEELRVRGGDRLAADPGVVGERTAGVSPEDPATIIYTSGTTGDPKGVVLSHRATVWTNESADRYLRRAARVQGMDYPDHRRMVSYLPLAHIAERQVTHYAALYGGNEVTFCPDPATLPGVLAETNPHFFVGVPRVWEKVKARLEDRIAQTPSPVRRRLAMAALDAGVRMAKMREQGKRPGLRLRVGHRFFDRLVLRRIRSALGLEQLIIALCGAAHVDEEVIWFFRGLGLPLHEAYGLSETTGYGTANAPGASKVGSVGTALPGVEVAIDTDGEVLLRGGMLASRYLAKPEESAAAFDADGWLHTGDVGSIDSDGFLTLAGRKREILITSGGKNVAPAPIERRIEQHPLVAHACVVGDRRRYLTALLAVDWEEAESWASERGLQIGKREAFVAHPEVRDSLRRWIDEVNGRLSRPEQIKGFTLLSAEWSIDHGEVTPTLKTVRHVIAQRHASDIEALYR